MKKLAIIFLIQFFSFQSIAQNLSIGDMQIIYSLPNWDAVDVYLTKKGWKFESSKKATYDKYGTIQWTYKKEQYNDKANGWFSLILDGSKFYKLIYQLADDTKYNLEKINIVQLGYKFKESQIENNKLISIYKNSSFYLKLVIKKESDSYSENEIYHAFYMERIPKVIVETPIVKTPPPVVIIEQNGYIKDIDGNSYKTVNIGDQIWMAENLNVTKYNDGALIPIVTDPTIWSNLSYPGMCWYDNDKNNYTINKYGALYNFYTVNTGKLCPIGWHVPSDGEWKILTNFLGGETVAGSKMKSITGWISNGNGTNTAAFFGLAAGFRDFDKGLFLKKNIEANWWSTTNKEGIYIRYVTFGSQSLNQATADKKFGFSVRC